MKLATLNEGGRDGTLVLVNRALTQAVRVLDVALTLQAALDNWAQAAPLLCARAAALEAGAIDTAFAFDPCACLAPLPRAYQWVDGSA